MKKQVENLQQKIQDLELVYKSYPQEKLLIAMPNPHPQRTYEVETTSAEFTSLCPLHPGQPDFARVTIRYTPDKHIVEFKSLKFYLTSYRMVEIYYEDATNRILSDLVAAVKPKKMEIIAEWTVRGGISTVVRATYSGKQRQ